ncbi:MAG: DUF3276 family protein [Marinifilaceae bacterium]|nr:DUF3276 family protein [Marinifilaceae bacterium]
METIENDERQEVYGKAVRAGKRTYYFDVKQTRNNDFYITITESKKSSEISDNKKGYEKHKIFLYKEDFEKFSTCLSDVIAYIKDKKA